MPRSPTAGRDIKPTTMPLPRRKSKPRNSLPACRTGIGAHAYISANLPHRIASTSSFVYKLAFLGCFILLVPKLSQWSAPRCGRVMIGRARTFRGLTRSMLPRTSRNAPAADCTLGWIVLSHFLHFLSWSYAWSRYPVCSMSFDRLYKLVPIRYRKLFLLDCRIRAL